MAAMQTAAMQIPPSAPEVNLSLVAKFRDREIPTTGASVGAVVSKSNVCMYVCMYDVCMYVCMYVCMMYVCMYVCIL